ncbi:MAG: rhomboid family intramembrane serine protease [Acidimicrobiales bacterium]
MRWRPRGAPAGSRGALGSTRMTPAVGVLIAVNVVVYLIEQTNYANVVTRFALVPALVHHEPYRLITAAFLHANLGHIFFNMVSLAILGAPVEATIGRARFVTLYLLAALGGSVASYLFSAPYVFGLGASGAVFGLMGAYFVLARRHHWDTSTVLVLIGFNFFYGFIAANIDWRAHLGGLITGALVTLGFMAAVDRRSPPAWAGQAMVCAAALAAFAALVPISPGHFHL